MSSINPYVVIDKIFKAQGKENYVSVGKTEVTTDQSPNPSYKPMKYKAQALCNSDFDQLVQFKVYNKIDDESPAILIGTVKKSMNHFND